MRDVLKKAVWVGALVIGALAAFQMPSGAQEPPVGAQEPASGAQEPVTGRKVSKRVPPIYPPLARKAGLSGTVKLVVTVLADGKVKSVRTVGGNALFVGAAETAVKGWTFEPAKEDSTEVVAVQFTR